MDEKQRAHRNLNPHAEARLAMAVWGQEYAFEQRGGSMDFWDNLSEARKRFCIDVVSGVLDANEKTGRASSAPPIPSEPGIADEQREG